MKQVHRAPLVGAYYRPPAAAILKRLPAEAPLRVVPEPDNPHDCNALAVHLATADYPNWVGLGLLDADFEQELAGFGFSIEDIHCAESFHLGYVARQAAAQLAPTVALATAGDPSAYCEAKLSFDPAGKPQVIIEL